MTNNVALLPVSDSHGDSPLSWPPALVGQARIIDMAFHGQDLVPMITSLTARANSDPHDAAALMDLASILVVLHKPAAGLALQREALDIEQVYRQPIPTATQTAPRVVMFASPGNFMANIPVEFLLEGSDISLDLVYVRPGEPLPSRIPEHDLAIVGIAESDESRPLLDLLSSTTGAWPVRVLDDPRRVVQLSRESLWRVLAGASGVLIPATVRLDRKDIALLGDDDQFPIILRPVGSHAGHGLEKIDAVERVAPYLEEQRDEQFYLSPFVDYRGADGLFRKYRIAFVDGRPFPSHMAIAGHWMLHYLNAGMDESADKRAEEARWFETFTSEFAVRHQDAFRALHERLGLEYFVIDCAEAPTGELLVFEADTAMVVHAMDSLEVFPYKRPHMRRLFQAFQAMLHAYAVLPAAWGNLTSSAPRR